MNICDEVCASMFREYVASVFHCSVVFALFFHASIEPGCFSSLATRSPSRCCTRICSSRPALTCRRPFFSCACCTPSTRSSTFCGWRRRSARICRKRWISSTRRRIAIAPRRSTRARILLYARTQMHSGANGFFFFSFFVLRSFALQM